MLILGLSPFEHDTTAALFEDGVVKAAIENDKLARTRTSGMPEQAIRFCLEKAGINWSDLDAIAFAPESRHVTGSSFVLTNDSSRFSGISPRTDTVAALGRHMTAGVSTPGTRPAMKIHEFDHQLCHAASSFFASPYDRALILTMDEQGDGNCGLVAIGEGTNIQVLHRIQFPNSLGWIYSAVTRLLGFTPRREEHKTQWLSLGAEPTWKNVFLSMFGSNSNSLPRLNRELVNPADHDVFSEEFYRQIGVADRTKPLDDETARSLAASLQQACSEFVGSLIRHYCGLHGLTQVCLAGGLFQNTLLVASLEKTFGLNNVFVPPAPGNSGCAMGAALLLWHSELGHPRQTTVSHLYSGPSSSRTEIKDVLDNCKARYSVQLTTDGKLDATLQLLEAGKIVGWFHGPTEFGPRALGNRSLLASPWAPYVRENLNDYIKHREWFRPFALAVPEEDCDRYFECSQLCQSMNSLASARPEALGLLDGFVLPGNFVRLQVVQKKTNLQFWQLLKRFGERAPAPLLVNTSFNLFGEPLVVKPRDAVRSYFCSGVDALAIDMFLLSKSPINHVSHTIRAVNNQPSFENRAQQ